MMVEEDTRGGCDWQSYPDPGHSAPAECYSDHQAAVIINLQSTTCAPTGSRQELIVDTHYLDHPIRIRGIPG